VKRLIVAILFLCPVSTEAGKSSNKASWVCSQPGHINDSLGYALSRVFEATENNYEDKEEIFEKRVRETLKDSFKPLDDPSCRDFSSRTKAERYLKKILKRAKVKFRILWIDFGSL